jgi:hypothetical protein
MARRCARVGCGDEAVASTLFVADSSRVEIIDLVDATAGIALCAVHTRRLTAPVGWVLVDQRVPRRVDLWSVAVPRAMPEPWPVS